MGVKFNPFSSALDVVDSPSGDFDDIDVSGDITLDDGGTYTTTVQVVTPTANRTISFPDATGTVALVAGSSGQLTYNDAGAQAGLTSASIGSTDEINISLAGAASTPPVSFTGSWFTGGTATTTKPQLLIEPTGTTSTAWSTDGTGLGVNAASGFAGRLLDLQTNGTSRMVVQGDGKLGIGTSGPLDSLSVAAATYRGLTLETSTLANRPTITFRNTGGSGNSAYIQGNNYEIAFGRVNQDYGGHTESARIDSSGRLLVGTSTALSSNSGHIIQAADSTGVKLTLGRSSTSVAADVGLAQLIGYSNGGGTYEQSGSIAIFSDGAHASGDKPGRLVFSTTADGASGPTERMRIRANGVINFSSCPTYADDAAAGTGGLVAGDIYKTSTGELRIKL